MFGDGSLTFREFIMREPLPLATIHDAVLEFLRGQGVKRVLVGTPPELIAGKIAAFVRRRGKPKAGTDWRDLALLLLTFPELKTEEGPVAERLHAAGASETILAAWKDLV